MAARSAAFRNFRAANVMVRVQSGTDTQAADERSAASRFSSKSMALSRMRVIPSAQSDGKS
eukprot:3236824-Prymnesium_polylepis.1